MGLFLPSARDGGDNQRVLLSAVFATPALKLQTQLSAEAAGALCFLVVCCEMVMHRGL